MPHDIVFREALVVDGTGAAPFVADVAVDGDTIVDLGPRAGQAALDIDARGLVLSPGFIDVHTHDDFALITSPDMSFKTLQGVTTVVTGNCGTSAWPFGEWLDNVRANPAAVNVSALVGHGTLREQVIGRGVDRHATDAEIARMHSMVEHALDSGAVGLSTGLVYDPGRFAAPDEVTALASSVAARGGIYTSHMRNERDMLLESIEETIAVGRATGVRVQVSHLKAIGEENYAKASTAVEMISSARAQGIDVMADQYPYARGSTALEQLVSAGAFDGPSQFGHVQGEDVLVASAPRNPGWEGRTLADIAGELGVDAPAAARHLVTREGGACMIVYANQSEDNIAMILSQDFVMIGSDGIPIGSRPHPRLHHTFPRVLGEYSRTRGVLDLATAVHRMTGLSAERFSMQDRGHIRAGKRADLVLFDPGTVADTGTYEDPTTVPAGIIGTWVNGVRATENGRSTGTRTGRVL